MARYSVAQAQAEFHTLLERARDGDAIEVALEDGAVIQLRPAPSASDEDENPWTPEWLERNRVVPSSGLGEDSGEFFRRVRENDEL